MPSGGEGSPGDASIRFPFRFARGWRIPLLLWGVTEARSAIEIGGGRVVARFGPWRIETPLANVKAHRVTGPYRAWSAIGVRRSVRGGDWSFCSNAERGVCLEFRVPVPHRPLFWIPALTVTPADVEGFAAALQERGVPRVPA